MGSNATSHVVYGYYLGGHEAGWRLKDIGEYGEMPEDLPWLDEGNRNVIDQAQEHLIQMLGGLDPSQKVSWEPSADHAAYDAWQEKRREAGKKVPVKFVMGGGYDFADWSLVTWSDKGDWGTPVILDLAALEERRITEDWDGKLAAALTALGIVPIQEKPAWFVFASYG